MSLQATIGSILDYTGPFKRQGSPWLEAAGGPSRLQDLLASGHPRAPVISPYPFRRYPEAVYAQVPNILNKLTAVAQLIPPGTQPELGLLPFRSRKNLVQMPFVHRVAFGANPFTAPPFVPIEFATPIYRGDAMRGQQFSTNAFITRTPFIYPDQPNPHPRKKWVIPEFGANSILPLTTFVVVPPFHQNDWNNFFPRARSLKFDDVPNGVYVITPAGPPFYQTDFPYVDYRLKLKEGTYFAWQNAVIPNVRPPPIPVVAPRGGAVIYGLFLGNSIYGHFYGGTDYT